MIKKKYLVPTLKVVKLKHAYYLQCGSANLNLGNSSSRNAELEDYSNSEGTEVNGEKTQDWGI